jgi:hypothetical protein
MLSNEIEALFHRLSAIGAFELANALFIFETS